MISENDISPLNNLVTGRKSPTRPLRLKGVEVWAAVIWVSALCPHGLISVTPWLFFLALPLGLSVNEDGDNEDTETLPVKIFDCDRMKDWMRCSKMPDYRMDLNNWGQAQNPKVSIRYEMGGSTGPANAPIWTAYVYVDGSKCGTGTGPNQGAAKEAAAYKALKKLNVI